MQPWVAFPHLGQYRFTAASVAAQWPRLHAGDAEPLPAHPGVLGAWVRLHNGEFQHAAAEGLAAGEAGVTYGVSKELGLRLFRDGLGIHPRSPIGMIEYGNGLLMLEGEDRVGEATGWYEQAARCEPADAVERLHVDTWPAPS